jgi:ribosomal protein L11 methyltransferase
LKYKELKINLPKENSEELSEFLETLPLAGYYEILFDSEMPKEDSEAILRENTNLRVYLDAEDNDSDTKILIFTKLLCRDSFLIESREIETREYEEAYKEFYKPLEIGSVWIVPIWERDSELVKEILGSGKIPVFLNPGVAFGTGHHETTQMIVNHLPKIFPIKGKILDIGTGSGILSLLCGKLGASEIFSLDIDPNAVKATKSNWQENQYPNNCKLEVVESGFDHPSVVGGEYDLVLANITFAVLSQNMFILKTIRSPRFLFSGVITERKDEFLDILSLNLPGYQYITEERNGWVLIDYFRN